MSLVAVNQIRVIHEAMIFAKKSKDSLKDCFENVNMCIFEYSQCSYRVNKLTTGRQRRLNG